MKFTEYLTEGKEGKNVHLEHIEDELLNRGVAGGREAINFLRSLRDMLAGQSQGTVHQQYLLAPILRMVSFLLALRVCLLKMQN